MRVRLVARTLRGYQRSWLGADAVAGLTLAAIAVPEQMAAVRLVSLPAVARLYTVVAGSVTFGLFGRGRTNVGRDGFH